MDSAKSTKSSRASLELDKQGIRVLFILLRVNAQLPSKKESMMASKGMPPTRDFSLGRTPIQIRISCCKAKTKESWKVVRIPMEEQLILRTSPSNNNICHKMAQRKIVLIIQGIAITVSLLISSSSNSKYRSKCSCSRYKWNAKRVASRLLLEAQWPKIN